MKLRAIRLENVRRFVEPAEIDGIGDGLNVLSAPNEYGKSTFFDALHAVFFKNRKSWDREVRGLVPHAGGDPTVAVDLELPAGRYRIVKRWNSRRAGEAQILLSGRLIKQADDAEAWIAETLKSPKDGGPAGLLWVRQGLTGLDGDDNARVARRDLLTSVAGEVEAMTGGRRMDAALDRCRHELDVYLTSTGRSKSHGPLKHAEDKAAALETERELLAAKSRRLQAELNRRRDLRRQLAELEDPEEDARRKVRLDEAQASFDEASGHAEMLDRATSDERAKRGEYERAKERLASLLHALSESAEAVAADTAATEEEANSSEQERLAEAAMSDAARTVQAAVEDADCAQDTLQRALRAEAFVAATRRRVELVAQLEKAEESRQQVEKASADAKAEISAQSLEDLEALDERVRILHKTRDLEAVAVTMAYASGRSAGVSLGGKPLQDAERTPIPDGAALQIESLGQLTVHPGRRADSDTLLAADAALTQALTDAGVRSIKEARASARRRIESENRGRDADAKLQAVAPDGIDALREQIAALPEQAASGDAVPESGDAQDAFEAARRVLADARERYEAARVAHGHAATRKARASQAAVGARARVARAGEALAGIDDPETESVAREEALKVLERQLEEASRRREEIADAAPNLEDAKARLKRARSIVGRADNDRQHIRIELGKLDTSIDIQAGEAVDEELADVETRLEMAERRLNELRFEVDVLQRLHGALEAARASARDRYLEPVVREIGPLLRPFWSEAELRFDPDAVLPSTLVRAGTEEHFDILSGGTQEQIALLVRLAFARMLARGGTPAPVILDDAIVYTADDRIERMFDALTRQAQDLQIIVFSCRQKAFRDLGGRGLSIVLKDSTSEAE